MNCIRYKMIHLDFFLDDHRSGTGYLSLRLSRKIHGLFHIFSYFYFEKLSKLVLWKFLINRDETTASWSLGLFTTETRFAIYYDHFYSI